MIYISTGGLKGQYPDQCVQTLTEMGFHALELSGGLFHPNTLESLKVRKKSVQFSVHNYFPPPETHFVVNLASLNPNILSLSLEHCERALMWSEQLGSPHYAVHAGFLVDPDPKELGKKIEKRALQDREKSKEVFCQSVQRLSEKAKARGVRLLIENNVISPRNFKEFGDNPLLMADSAEIEELMKALPKSVGLLLDVAHLKVSAQTLGLSLERENEKIAPWVSGYHLSDNDGTVDSNDAYDSSAWFLPLLQSHIDYATVEVYQYDKEVLQKQLELLQNKFI